MRMIKLDKNGCMVIKRYLAPLRQRNLVCKRTIVLRRADPDIDQHLPIVVLDDHLVLLAKGEDSPFVFDRGRREHLTLCKVGVPLL
ncbi:MAG: hypothetical protein DRI69_05085 [Bacteroidetes bacterium]|nr:MAG: hypothetical protein DRI69_05085 [Bacteroidota bacterium]